MLKKSISIYYVHYRSSQRTIAFILIYYRDILIPLYIHLYTYLNRYLGSYLVLFHPKQLLRTHPCLCVYVHFFFPEHEEFHVQLVWLAASDRRHWFSEICCTVIDLWTRTLTYNYMWMLIALTVMFVCNLLKKTLSVIISHNMYVI